MQRNNYLLQRKFCYYFYKRLIIWVLAKRVTLSYQEKSMANIANVLFIRGLFDVDYYGKEERKRKNKRNSD